MKLHNKFTNKECIGMKPTFSYNDRMRNVEISMEGDVFYYDVWINGNLAYCDGEYVEIIGYSVEDNNVTIRNEEDNIFTISYEQYIDHFGMEWE